MTYIKCGGTAEELPLVLEPNKEKNYPGAAICPVCNYAVLVTPASLRFLRLQNGAVLRHGTLKTHYVDMQNKDGVKYRKPKDTE